MMDLEWVVNVEIETSRVEDSEKRRERSESDVVNPHEGFPLTDPS